MKFAQIIEYKTSRPDEVEALEEEWRTRTEGVRPSSVAFYGTDRDRPDTYMACVQWDSYEDAQRNNNLQVTNDIAAKLAALCDEPPTFRNLDVVSERST
jgi:hypothetical protein